MGQSSRDISYLPTAVDAGPDQNAIATLIKLIGYNDQWTDADERRLKTHLGLSEQQQLPGANAEIFAKLRAQVLAAVRLGNEARMERGQLQRTRNTIRAIIAVSQSVALANPDQKDLLTVLITTPLSALVADTKFLKPLALYCNERGKPAELTVADIIDLPVPMLLVLSPTPDYTAVQQLINELAVFGITMPPHVQPNFVDELPDYALWAQTDTPLSTTTRVLPRKLTVGEVLKAHPKLPRAGDGKLTVTLAAAHQMMLTGVDTLEGREIVAILSRHQITTVEQLLQKTVADLGKMGMRDKLRTAVIQALAFEGCLLKDAIKVPY
ncbi:hypothetical protein KA517_01780 [Candidatus Gracilibacteria bacterium]|nr:hypothetical protein [Candidatus Gracilibacteria bacterium]